MKNTQKTLKKLAQNFEFCGHQEDFTTFCFRYGTIVKEYRNELERDVYFNVDGINCNVVIQSGQTEKISFQS